jgi:hypothetical protein
MRLNLVRRLWRRGNVSRCHLASEFIQNPHRSQAPLLGPTKPIRVPCRICAQTRLLKSLRREADMPARVMLSSVTKDDLPLGDIGKLKDFWYESETLPDRLQQSGWPLKAGSRIDITFARNEIQHHLAGKYEFEVYNL